MKIQLILGSIFLAVGILLGATLGVCCILNVQGIKESVPITATIEKIERVSSHSNKKDNYTVYATFTNPTTGEEAYKQLNFYYSGMYEGKDIEVYYNLETGEILSESNTFLFGGLGILFFVIFGSVGVIFLVLYRKQKKKEKRLKLEGKKIYAKVTDVGLNYHYRMNGQPAQYLICEVENEMDGTTQIYKSKGFFSDRILQRYPKGSLIPVYINYKDKSSYIVDIEDGEKRKEII